MILPACKQGVSMSSGGEGKKGRPPVLTAEHHEQLRTLVQERPGATLEELRAAFVERSGVSVSGPTLRAGLTAAGIERIKPTRRRSGEAEGAREEGAGRAARRYGYTEAHREAAESVRLTEAEWALGQDLFEAQDPRGREPKYPRRVMVEACCYVLRTGCPWRLLPVDFPPWGTVHKSFSRWAAQGVFERFHDRLRAQWRERVGKAAAPTAAVLDSQSTRISPQGGASGYDAGKKVKGRKRHLLVDTLGLLLAVTVTAASVQDRDGALPTVAAACAKHPTLTHLYVDSAYAGGCAQHLAAAHELRVEGGRRPAYRTVGRGDDAQPDLFDPPAAAPFVILPKRWVVERSHAWIERSRRLVMHHDRSLRSAAAWVWLAEARMLARRLTWEAA